MKAESCAWPSWLSPPPPPLPDEELMRLGVFLRLLVSVTPLVFVYLRSRELVVVVPLSRPVVADAFDDVDADDDDDADEHAPVMLAFGDIDDDESSVTCWALIYFFNFIKLVN